MSIRVEVVTAWWNEAILAPFFLNHYAYADTIHVLLDEDTSDDTRKYLYKAGNVQIYPIRYPDGIDWEIKSQAVNDLANNLQCDWVIAVDADEFIWPMENMDNTKGWLAEQEGTLISAALFTVYRHNTESDLDPENPSVYQRRHGDSRLGISYEQTGYIKPCVVRPEIQIEWSCGIHQYKATERTIENRIPMVGAHWCMADPVIAITRRIGQKERQSKNNKEKSHGIQNFNITKEEIISECRHHEFDPKLF
jgi:hypothetical protein